MKEDDGKNESERNATIEAGVSGAAADTVSRYGGAVKEHIVAYSGIDNENGVKLKRSLKSISKSKVNDQYRDANLKQQAGFGAETKETARRRAEQQIKGKKPTAVRTDDIPGHVNDPLYDITDGVDAQGNPIPGKSVQMKFVGSSPKAAVGKLLGKGFQKYRDNNCKIAVPSDYFDGMKQELSDRMASLEKQIERCAAKGDDATVEKLKAKLKECKKLRGLLRKSSVSNAEAMEARTSPKISTAKDMGRVMHRGGMEAAKGAACIGGVISLVRNAMDLFSGKKSGGEAAKDVALDTAQAAALGYGTGAVGALAKGVLQNSKSTVLRQMATKTSLPAYIASTTLEIGKTLTRYAKGEIGGEQCLNELGEKGYGMINSAFYAGVGQVLIPIPVVGALAGGMMGYALSSASYKILTESLRDARLAHARRLEVEKDCAEAIEMMRACRRHLEKTIKREMSEQRAIFNETFNQVKSALKIGDVDGYIDGMNKMTVAMGGKPQFSNYTEFDDLMNSDTAVVL